jgi:hypothetical protein
MSFFNVPLLLLQLVNKRCHWIEMLTSNCISDNYKKLEQQRTLFDILLCRLSYSRPFDPFIYLHRNHRCECHEATKEMHRTFNWNRIFSQPLR